MHTLNPLPTLLLLMLASLPFCASAAQSDTGSEAVASTAITDTGALYKIERSEAGALPMDMLLGQQLPADTSVLTMEIGKQRYHALRQDAERAEPLGSILLLPDPGVGTAWPEQVAALRFDLARHGWLTLALEPPQPSIPKLPERSLPVMKSIKSASANTGGTESTPPPQPASDTANTAIETGNAGNKSGEIPLEPLAPFAERFNERLGLVLEQLPKEENQPLILMAFGRSANWSAAYLAAHPELKASLVLLDPLPDTDADTPKLSDLWQGLSETRIVDLYHVPLPGYPQAAPDARIRKAQARRAKLTLYHQSRITPPFTGWHQEMPWLTQTVRGLIKSQILEPTQQAQESTKNRSQSMPQQTAPGTAPTR